MRTLTLPRLADLERETWARYGRMPASDADYDLLVEEPTVLYQEGDPHPVAVYEHLGAAVDTEKLAASLLPTRPGGAHARTSGLASRSHTFGFRPRLTVRKMEWCGPFAFNHEHPGLYDELRAVGDVAASRFATYRPELFAEQVATLDAEVLPEYRLSPGSPYTSGIINYDNPLAYHRDQGNFRSTWNAMLVLRRDALGGHLVVPAWRLAFAAGDGSLVLFGAHSMTHGVSPLTRRTRAGYRISIVYYALSALRACLPCDEELAQARAKRTEREQRRAGLVP